MTFTFKLARRLARLRSVPALLVPVLAACAAGEPTSISSDVPTDPTADGPVALSPREVTLEGTQHVLFRAFESLIPGSSQVTSIEWTATGGMIGGDGSYTPTATGAFKVVGRRKGNPHNPPDTAIVVVVPPQPTVIGLVLNPSTATVGGGLQQQFTVVGRLSDGSEVPVGVTWTTTGGAIDEGGLYTATRTAGSYKVIAKHATTGLADTAVVTVPAATLTSITLTPGSTSLSAGQGQQFSVTARLSDGTVTSSVPVAYSATGGSVSVSGYYTAGSAGGSYRVIATAAGGKADTSTVSITTSTTTGSVLWSGDFESGAYPSGTTFEQCQAGRIAVYSNTNKPAGAPNARAGTYFSGHRLLDSDVSPCTPTVNPRTSAYKQAIFQPGQEVWEAFSVYIPNGLPRLPGYFLVEEDYGAPFNSTPPSALYLQDNGSGNHWYVTGNYDAATKTNIHVWNGPAVTTGVWHDVVWHKRFATDKSGYIEMWFDGQQVVWYNGTTRLTNQQTMLTGATNANFSLMQYRKAGMFPLSSWPNGFTIYFDEARVGTTRSAVDIQSTLLASAP